MGAELKYCHICKRELNQPNDLTTKDCGGDCLQCMSDCGDPDCTKDLEEKQRKHRAEHTAPIDPPPGRGVQKTRH